MPDSPYNIHGTSFLIRGCSMYGTSSLGGRFPIITSECPSSNFMVVWIAQCLIIESQGTSSIISLNVFMAVTLEFTPLLEFMFNVIWSRKLPVRFTCLDGSAFTYIRAITCPFSECMFFIVIVMPSSTNSNSYIPALIVVFTFIRPPLYTSAYHSWV